MKQFKIVDSSQARLVNQYTNTKRKLLRINAHIWFNRTCKSKNITPNYAKQKLKDSTHAAKLTQKQLTKVRINNELKFLYIKKHQINNKLYKIHLKNAQFWQSNWQLLENNINETLNEETKEHYAKLKRKINKQIVNDTQLHNKQTFYPRTHNLTNIQFTKNEEDLLNKGIKNVKILKC